MNTQVDQADKIVVATDFSDSPGARYRTDGPKSGEEFLEDLLRPRFVEAMTARRTLIVDLDGAWGYASSFLSGSFGALAHEFGAKQVNAVLRIISDEDTVVFEKVRKEIESEGDRG